MSKPNLGVVVSRHYFRRTARKAAHDRNETLAVNAPVHYTVEPSTKGPYRWYVRRHPLPERVASALKKIPLTDLIKDACGRFGVEYDRVAEIRLFPGHAEVVVFGDEKGRMVVDGEAVQRTLAFQIES